MKKLENNIYKIRAKKLELIMDSNILLKDICNKYKITISNLYRLASRDIKYDLVLKDIYKHNLELNKKIEELVFDNGKKG